jgi:hypothetical protein
MRLHASAGGSMAAISAPTASAARRYRLTEKLRIGSSRVIARATDLGLLRTA